MKQYLDKNGVETLWDKAKNKFVVQEEGKQLSSEDFTTKLKEQLEEIIPSEGTPIADSKEGAAGNSTEYSRADHSHPSDNSKLDKSLMGVADGVATLDSAGKIPSEQLPSYVDDVIELINMIDVDPNKCEIGDKYYNTELKKIFTADAENSWELNGEDPLKGVIYINLIEINNNTYRWGGTEMIKITSNDIIPISNEELDEILI